MCADVLRKEGPETLKTDKERVNAKSLGYRKGSRAGRLVLMCSVMEGPVIPTVLALL